MERSQSESARLAAHQVQPEYWCGCPRHGSHRLRSVGPRYQAGYFREFRRPRFTSCSSARRPARQPRDGTCGTQSGPYSEFATFAYWTRYYNRSSLLSRFADIFSHRCLWRSPGSIALAGLPAFVSKSLARNLTKQIQEVRMGFVFGLLLASEPSRFCGGMNARRCGLRWPQPGGEPGRRSAGVGTFACRR